MGYVLLWMESLATSLLLVGTLLACTCRLRRRWLVRTLAGIVVLLPLAVYVPAIVFGAMMKYHVFCPVPVGQFYPLLATLICYLIGAAWISWVGLRPREDAAANARAAGWPPGRLALALGVVLSLHLMTFWNLDAAVKQKLAAVREEAGRLALSVAPLRLPDAQNAAPVYRRAFEAVQSPEDWPLIWRQALDALDDGEYIVQPEECYQQYFHSAHASWRARALGRKAEYGSFDYAGAELGEFLDERGGPLATIRQAATRPGCYFERDYGRTAWDTLVPELSRFWEAARLLAVDARHKAEIGDLRGAMEDLGAMFSMDAHAGAEPLLVATLTSMAISNLGVQTLEAVLLSAPATEEDLAVLALDEGVSYREHLARAFRMEEAVGLSLFAYFDGQQTPAKIVTFEIGPLHQPPLLNLYRVFLLSDDLDSFRRVLGRYHRACAREFHETRGLWEDPDGAMAREGAGMCARHVLPVLGGTVERAQEACALRRAALLGVSLYRYQARNGGLPDRLEELSPELIPIVPRDPFDGKPMRLKRTDEGCIVYAIGLDLDDDQGAPFDRKKRTGDVAFRVAPYAGEAERKP